MADTSIEWTNKVWNPTSGCDRVSPGCDHCYALTLAKRLKGMGSAKYQRDGDPRTSGPGFGITEHPDTLTAPLGWRKPRKVFVNSMSDLFHDGVSDEHIARVFAVMAAAPRHTFQVLTKRHARMRSLLSDSGLKFRDAVWNALCELIGDRAAVELLPGLEMIWPLPNVWVGVSVESQQWADIRIPALLNTPAAVRWISAEPLLGPVDLSGPIDALGYRTRLTYWLTGRPTWTPDGVSRGGLLTESIELGPRIDWVVAGGESGPGARPMHPAWVRALRDQCVAAKVPFLMKQWGEWAPSLGRSRDQILMWPDGTHRPDTGPPYTPAGWTNLERVGKGKAGRELDGRTWDEYPVSAEARADGRARPGGTTEPTP